MHGVRLALVCGSLALAGCGGGGETTTDTPAPAAGGSELRYGVIGDSYSNGEGVGAEFAWPELLAGRMSLELVINPAISGWTTEQALADELPAFEEADPEVATLLIGANDLVQGVPLPTFRARFRRLLRSMIATVGEPARVVAVTIPDFSVKPVGGSFGPRAALARVLGRFNAVIRAESAGQRVAVADITAVSRFAKDPSPDGLHPSARELEAWTDVIERVARRSWSDLS